VIEAGETAIPAGSKRFPDEVYHMGHIPQYGRNYHRSPPRTALGSPNFKSHNPKNASPGTAGAKIGHTV
jgi:hypothetical protein